MKTGRRLALTLGLATGALVTVMVSGRTTKRRVPYTIGRASESFTSTMYDDSQINYI